MKIITVGADPEFLVYDKKGQPYPSIPFAEGTKDHPKGIPELGPGFSEQRDNITLEGNIPPAKSKEEFISNVTAIREYFARKVGKFGYSIAPSGVEYFPKRMLDNPEAQEFGCSSVIQSWYNCYNGTIIESATPNLAGLDYRLAGFHIHIGIEHPRISMTHDALLIGRLFDFFLTIPSHKIRSEPERLQTYGMYGIIRIPKYGVECRTLSSFFTQSEYLPWVYDQIMKIESVINESNTTDLRRLIRDRMNLNDAPTFRRQAEAILSAFTDPTVINKHDELKAFYTESINKQHEAQNNNANKNDYYTISGATNTAATW